MPDPVAPDDSEEIPEPPSKGATTIPVVGIGGSAGGLEVFKHLLTDLPGDTGLAIVFVQHLDPKHHSLLTEILARSTTMPVSEAADDMPVEANHVYVIPANSRSRPSRQGALRLAPRTQGPGAHMPIDRFLRSLADECGSRAIGVILSGAGTDGSAGVQAIKAAGRRDLRPGPVHREVRLHAAGRGGHQLRGFRSAAGPHCRGVGEDRPPPLLADASPPDLETDARLRRSRVR